MTTTALQDVYERDGCVCVPGTLGAPKLAAMRNALEECIANLSFVENAGARRPAVGTERASSLKGAGVSGMIFDELIGSSVTVDLDGSPPDDHFVAVDPVAIASEIPLTYDDTDESGDFSIESDVILSALCLDDDPVSLFYIGQTTDLQTGLQFAMSDGIKSGWNALGTHLNKKGETEEYMLTHEDLTKLSAHDYCQFLD